MPTPDAAMPQPDAATTEADAMETGGEGRPPLCTPGADQTCNDDPMVSALWGACEVSGVCVCKDGFSINRATGRCRYGSACVASASDSWPVSVRLGPQNCVTRAPSPCTSTSGTVDDMLTAEIGSILTSECQFTSRTFLRIELLAGCPTLLELDHDPSDQSLFVCLEKVLSAVRLSCAGNVGCALFEWVPPP
jgi:hypothetical protein